MPKIGLIDLEIIHLGISHGGNFNEMDLESSELKRLGVGRILDSLASLKERNFIEMSPDGSFKITNSARQILWNKNIPLWLRILRLLEIKSQPIEKILEFLGDAKSDILNEIEAMRKNQLIMASPIRTESSIEKVYEVLQDGVDELKDIEEKGFENANLVMKTPSPMIEVLEIIDDISKQINDEENLDSTTKQSVTEKLNQIRKKLDI